VTRIEWTDATWNPVVGCTPVSPGCANCYAATFASRFGAVWPGVAAHGKWTKKILLRPEVLDVPLHWRKPRRKPRRVFVCSMSDLFHQSVPFSFIDRVFAVMALCPQHQFQALTKRPERMAEYIARGGDGIWSAALDIDADRVRPETDPGWPLRNVWLGTSCEDQATADERIPHLLRCPAAVRFLSCEPLLDEIDLSGYMNGPYVGLPGDVVHPNWNAGIDWVIVGGESGPKARPCNVEWIRGIVRRCQSASVPIFVKQLGVNVVGETRQCCGERWLNGSRSADCPACFGMGACGVLRYTPRDAKGADPAEWPADLRVRQWPEVQHVSGCKR